MRDKTANSLSTKVLEGFFVETMNPNAKAATQVVLEEKDFIASVVVFDNQNGVVSKAISD